MSVSLADIRSGLLSYGLDRPPSGIGRYTIELITAMAKLGVSPALLGDPATFLPDSSGYIRFPLPGTHLLPGLVTVGNFVVPGIVRQAGLNIIHDPTGNPPFLFGAGQAKTIVTVHDMFAFAFPGTSTLIETLLTRFWLPLVLPDVDAVITDSQCSKNDIIRYTKVAADKIHVIPIGQRGFSPICLSGAQTVLSRYGLEPGYILSVSSFEMRRNLPRLLQAYSRLYQEGERRRLVLVGKPRLGNKDLVELVQKLGLQHQVVFPGYVDLDELSALYSSADLFVFPSLYEGFGLPPLEAMACGTPVVVSNASALPEVVGDAAIMVDPYSVDALAEGMRRVLADPTLQADLRARGLKRAAEFSWQRTARLTLELYKEVLS